MPSTLGAAPSIEFVVLLGHARHNNKVLPAQYPAIGARIRCWQALIRARLLGASACSYRVRLRFQFFRLFRFLVEMAPVLEQPFSGFDRSIPHGEFPIHNGTFVWFSVSLFRRWQWRVPCSRAKSGKHQGPI